MSIFISTGEISGDLYAAKLCESFSRLKPETELWGMTGELAVGVRREWDNSALHIMGLTKIVKSLPKLFRLRNQLAEAVATRNPEAVIVIDSPDFHIPLLRKIRALGYKGATVYVSPPTIWAWRSGRAKYLRRYCDMCLPLFSFEEKALERHHVTSFWCGHPLIDDFKDYVPSEVLPEDDLRVALLPGSRRSEIRMLMPVLEETAVSLRDMGLHPVFSVAPGLDEECRELVVKNRPGIESTRVSGRSLMSQSKFVVAASGTAAVEAMLLDKYTIVIYKGTPLEWRIYTMLTKTKMISIPNVLAGRIVYPELLQENAECGKIMEYVKKYLGDDGYRRAVHDQIARNKGLMGESGAVDRWVRAILGLVKA